MGQLRSAWAMSFLACRVGMRRCVGEHDPGACGVGLAIAAMFGGCNGVWPGEGPRDVVHRSETCVAARKANLAGDASALYIRGVCACSEAAGAVLTQDCLVRKSPSWCVVQLVRQWQMRQV